MKQIHGAKIFQQLKIELRVDLEEARLPALCLESAADRLRCLQHL